jgi:hypothetical protein
MINTSVASPVSYLRDENERHRALFNAQPTIVKRFLEAQAQRLAEAVTNDARQVRFTLPDRVVDKTPQMGEMAVMLVPSEIREQTVGNWFRRFQRLDLREEVRQRLSSLEQSPDQAINTSVSLLRYATAVHMIYNLLPAGRSVTYRADGDEQIPTIPVKAIGESASAITQVTDAIVEQNPAENEQNMLQVPFVPAAQRFYLPQWVAFDEKGNLLVNSVAEAEAQLASMERYVKILHTASSLAPYMVADDEYQCKRYGILGQVINQGRALARYQTEQIIQIILKRIKKGILNRGLSISLPFYDDQELRLAEIQLEAIPAGRIGFKPVFVVRAARLEHAKVSQDTRLNPSTRKHLLRELELLEQAFINYSQ